MNSSPLFILLLGIFFIFVSAQAPNARLHAQDNTILSSGMPISPHVSKHKTNGYLLSAFFYGLVRQCISIALIYYLIASVLMLSPLGFPAFIALLAWFVLMQLLLFIPGAVLTILGIQKKDRSKEDDRTLLDWFAVILCGGLTGIILYLTYKANH